VGGRRGRTYPPRHRWLLCGKPPLPPLPHATTLSGWWYSTPASPCARACCSWHQVLCCPGRALVRVVKGRRASPSHSGSVWQRARSRKPRWVSAPGSRISPAGSAATGGVEARSKIDNGEAAGGVQRPRAVRERMVDTRCDTRESRAPTSWGAARSRWWGGKPGGDRGLTSSDTPIIPLPAELKSDTPRSMDDSPSP
jgi:hypothetical protein